MTNTPDWVAKYIAHYVKLRDAIKQMEDLHKEKMKPYRETLEQLGNLLLDHLNQTGLDRAGVEGVGTVYRTEKKSATIADKSIFWDYVVTSQNWELLDYKANVTAVAEHIDTEGKPPPGVNYTTINTVGVRRA